MNKATKNALIVGCFAAVIFLALWYRLSPNDEVAAGSGASAGEAVLEVQAEVLMPQSVRDAVFSTGSVIANEEVEIRSEISGKIIAILFKEGRYVDQGDILVRINDDEPQARLQIALQQKKLAEENEFRLKTLLEKETISQEEYDVARSRLDVILAEMKLIEAQIKKTEIKAPFSGIIGLKDVSVGDYISPAVGIARLQDIGRIKVDFSIPEKYAGRAKKNDRITFTVQSSQKTFEAVVYAIEPKIDPATRTLRLRAISWNKGNEVLPGSFANIEYTLREIKDALMIPTSALIPELQGHKVFLFKNGAAEAQPVVTGIRTESRIQIVEGLAPGDTLITTGILQVRSGSPVRISAIN